MGKTLNPFNAAPSDSVTLSDIAKRCKLSKASVSRALSMSAKDCPLSPATRSRVRRVSREMGYRVNAKARALTSGKSMAIGLVYEGTLPILDSVYHQIIETFAATIRQQGYHLALVAVDDTSHWEDSLLGGLVDGAVCLHNFPERVEPVIQKISHPLVLLNGKSAFASGTVSVDDRRGATMITEHLLGLGHRRIMMLTDMHRETPHYSIAERQNGFLQTMRDSGLPGSQPICFEGDADGFAAEWAKLDEKPTAALCYSHVEAIHALRVLKRAGVQVPGQVSLATFNDVFPVAELDPALTCVAIQSAEIGRLGGQMLLELLSSPNKSPLGFQKEIVLDPIIIERESTAAVNA